MAFNCVLLNALPYEIAAGAFQVIVGTLLVPVPSAVMVTCVEAFRVSGVTVAAGGAPAGWLQHKQLAQSARPLLLR